MGKSGGEKAAKVFYVGCCLKEVEDGSGGERIEMIKSF